jgi:hypothetical protein
MSSPKLNGVIFGGTVSFWKLKYILKLKYFDKKKIRLKNDAESFEKSYCFKKLPHFYQIHKKLIPRFDLQFVFRGRFSIVLALKIY